MPRYEIDAGLYVAPTPAGAYHAVSAPGGEPSRRLLRALLRRESTPPLNVEGVMAWTGIAEETQALQLLYHVQGLGWLQGFPEPRQAPAGTLEELLPGLLGQLSVSGKGLLADAQGFYVATQRFSHEAAEELSALSADIASMHERHGRLLHNNIGVGAAAWALVDAAGCSQVGFWPLYIGASRFVLVLGSEPRLQRPAFTELVWALSTRYGREE
ncbi:MAG: hypothetical protein U1F11_01005 [Steroidobacteraceae bacterium]